MKLLLVLALVSATFIESSWAILDEVKKGEGGGGAHPAPELFSEEGHPVDVAKPLPIVLDHEKDKESEESDEMIRSRHECDRWYQQCNRNCGHNEFEGRHCMRRCERDYYDCLGRLEHRP